jgi:hypothetical protein
MAYPWSRYEASIGKLTPKNEIIGDNSKKIINDYPYSGKQQVMCHLGERLKD